METPSNRITRGRVLARPTAPFKRRWTRVRPGAKIGPVLTLLDRGDRGPDDPSLLDQVPGGAGLGRRGRRIRCPRCGWVPRRESRWWCSPCGTAWNTFETRGLCPGCGKQWEHTACLRCGQWSRHADWYE